MSDSAELKRRIPETCRDLVDQAVAAERAACAEIARNVAGDWVPSSSRPPAARAMSFDDAPVIERCHRCGYRQAVLADEAGMHPCGRCGYWVGDERE